MKKLMCMTISMFICGGIISNDCCAKAISEKKPLTANKETYNLAIEGFGKNIDQIINEEKQIDVSLKKLKFSSAETKALLKNVETIMYTNGRAKNDVKKVQSTIKKCLSAVAGKHESLFDKLDTLLLKLKSQKDIRKQENLVNDNLDDSYEDSLYGIYERVNGGSISKREFSQLNTSAGFASFIHGLNASSSEDYRLLYNLGNDGSAGEAADAVYLAVLEFVSKKKSEWINNVYKKGKGSLKLHIDNLKKMLPENGNNAYVEETRKFLSELEGFIVFEWFLKHTRAFSVESINRISAPVHATTLPYTNPNSVQQYQPQTMELPIKAPVYQQPVSRSSSPQGSARNVRN